MQISLPNVLESPSGGHRTCRHHHGSLWHQVLAPLCATINMCPHIQNSSSKFARKSCKCWEYKRTPHRRRHVRILQCESGNCWATVATQRAGKGGCLFVGTCVLFFFKIFLNVLPPTQPSEQGYFGAKQLVRAPIFAPFLIPIQKFPHWVLAKGT